MSEKLISLNEDLSRLKDDGYEISIQSNYLVIDSIPYVDSHQRVKRGRIVSELTLTADKTQKPGSHQVWWVGEKPHTQLGKPILALGLNVTSNELFDGIRASFHFSNKPKGGYLNYHHKVTSYVDILSNEAKALDPNVTARTHSCIKSYSEESPFKVIDTASSRAGISSLASRHIGSKVGIIGVGGTGAFTLDLISKTPVREIHIFDGDVFSQHNAFRSPGAASAEELERKPLKVDYLGSIYDKFHSGVIRHPYFLCDANLEKLDGLEFIFICVDSGEIRKLLYDYLTSKQIPFIDTGISVELVDENNELVGLCRCTLVTEKSQETVKQHLNFGSNSNQDVYHSNIQLAELNMLCASLAVIKWKKYLSIYQDCFRENQSVYAINTHQLTRDECE